MVRLFHPKNVWTKNSIEIHPNCRAEKSVRPSPCLPQLWHGFVAPQRRSPCDGLILEFDGFVRQNHFYWHLCGVFWGTGDAERLSMIGWRWKKLPQGDPVICSGCRNLGSDGPPRQECGHRRPVGIWRTQNGEKHIVWVPSRGLEDPICYNVCARYSQIFSYWSRKNFQCLWHFDHQLTTVTGYWASCSKPEMMETQTHTHNLLEPKSPQNLRDPGMLGWRCCQLPTAIFVGVGVCMMS